MSKTRNQDFLRGTDEQQARVVTITALAVIAVVAAVIVTVVWIVPHFDKPDGLPVSIEVPSVAPGVAKGTKVILRGTEVGEITELDKTGNGPVRMSLLLDPDRLHGVTDAFDIDFRPANYFGITAVNIVNRTGGGHLVAGQVLNRVPAGDFTMSTMLEKGSLAIDGTLTQSMITALDKVIRYTDGLTPMIQTGVVFADRVAQTQRAIPSELLGRANDILAVLPAFSGQAIDTLYNVYNNGYNKLPDGSWGIDDARFDDVDKGLGLVSDNLFGAAGLLLQSQEGALTPVTQVVHALVDAIPHMLDGGMAAGKLSELVDRYNRAFSAGPDGGKTLNLRIALDDLPMVSAPLAVTGLPQILGQELPR